MNFCKPKILPVVFFLFIGTTAFGQCNDQLIDTALTKIESFTYLKDFKVRLKKAKKNSPQAARYTVILSKDTKYRFTTTNAKEYPGELIWTLYDSNGVVMSNFVASKSKAYSVVDMTCKKSGRYYLTYSFLGGASGCGVGLLSFRNKTKTIDELIDY